MRPTSSSAGGSSSRATDRDGSETVLSVLDRGEIVGEMGLLHTAARSATVTAIRPSVLLRLTADDFEALVGSHPRLLRTITTTVLDRLSTPPPRAAAGRDDRRRGRARTRSRDRSCERSLPRSSGSGRCTSSPPPSGSAPGSADSLDRAEISHRHVVLDAGPPGTEWMDLAVTRADRVLVVASSGSGAYAASVFDRIGSTPVRGAMARHRRR